VPAPPLLRPLTGHPGIGPSTADKLAARGLQRVIDALYFLPRRWDDLRQLVRVGELQPGVLQSTVVVVERSRVVWARRRFLEALLRGEDGEPLLARWFYYVGGMQRRLQPGARFLLTGTPVRFRNALQIVHPELTELTAAGGAAEPAAGQDKKAPELGRVRVRYPEVEGVPPRTVERLCQSLCQQYADEVPDGIPQTLLHKLSLPALPDALRALHLSAAELPPAQLELLNQGLAPPQRRLIFEELFFLQLGLCQRRRSARVETATPCHAGPEVLDRLRAVLPFTPTGAQERAIAELQRDLAQPHPMQRLLHGDVGSGKTLVAYAACELVMAAGHQAAFMAPTEILAEQHKKTLTPWAEQTGRRIALLTATTPKTARKTTLALLQAGRFDDVWRLASESAQVLDRETILAMLAAGFLHLVIGTHALLAERVEFADLGLVVIDEQHRFGVAQRAALRKKGVMPHLLVMTATPIPRTLALTLYGDLDVTQLDELPPGRTPPVTRVLAGRAGAARAVAALGRAVAAGRQAYWVCPLIEESDKIDLANATARHAALCAALPQCRVGLVHGRLNTDERDQVMEQFRAGALHILVATTVIEVGVDVPNASLMVVESAERFGLAQLHQLRGRIGRGAGPSACLLMHGTGTGTDPDTDADADANTDAEGPRAAAPDPAAAGKPRSQRGAGKSAGEPGKEPGAAATEPADRVAADLGATRRKRALHAASPATEPVIDRGGDREGGRGGPAEPPPPLPGSGTTARARLEILARMSNGFHIAEADLRIRGPGEVLGTRQAGLPPLRYADLLRDLDLLQIARREAAALLGRDPDLSRPEHELMKRVLSERWASAEMSLE
jgi:ATP-dependent DNA helicase RecG